MTRRWPCIVALLCLLGLATSAFAECAWVLWVEQDLAGSTKNSERHIGWTVVEAAPTEAKCQEQLRTQIEAARNASSPKGRVMYKLLPNGRGIDLAFFDTWDPKGTVKRTQTLLYNCLPDTVDPRGPKGK